MKKVILGLGLALFLAGASVAEGPGGPGKHGRHGNPIERMKQTLKLSDSQVNQLQPMFEEMRQRREAERAAFKAKMDSILTPEQKAKLAAAGTQEGVKRRGVWKDLNLTDDQKNQLKAFRQERRNLNQGQREQFQQRLNAVLTPEQQAQWKQLKESHRGHRSHKGDRGQKPQQ